MKGGYGGGYVLVVWTGYWEQDNIQLVRKTIYQADGMTGVVWKPSRLVVFDGDRRAGR
jgi:hypothetical protein